MNSRRPQTTSHKPDPSMYNSCEEDYAVTLYLAEFINSITNFTYSETQTSSLMARFFRP
jgi:hypothetical protein